MTNSGPSSMYHQPQSGAAIKKLRSSVRDRRAIAAKLREAQKR